MSSVGCSRLSLNAHGASGTRVTTFESPDDRASVEENSSGDRASREETIPILGEALSVDLPQLGPAETGTRSQAVSVTQQLYVSHFLSTWNSRVFEFGAVLFLARAFPGTLWPSSFYALIRAAAAVVFSPALGGYIDQGERLRVARRSIIGQRGAVVFSCFLFGGFSLENSPWTELKGFLFAGVCLGAIVEKLYSIMNLIAIERDWVVVIAESTGADLEDLNSQMRRIDLFCKLLGPLFIAFVDGTSTIVAIYTIGGMGLITMFVEYYAIAQVYGKVDSLQPSRTISASQTDNSSDRPRTENKAIGRMKQCSASLLQYIHHPVFLPSIALSVLYFTVLSFSGQMITYLVSVKFTSIQIGLLRTASVILELSATWFAPMIIDRVGPVRAGLWSINWQLLCLVPTVSLFSMIHAPFTMALIMVAGVVMSRVGLWGFDLSVQLLVQESVEPKARGSFSSMEASFQNFFELCAYLSTLVFSRPDQFRFPILMSAAAILVADATYAKYVVDSRGHLIHLSKCMVRPGASTRWNLKHGTDIGMQDMP